MSFESRDFDIVPTEPYCISKNQDILYLKTFNVFIGDIDEKKTRRNISPFEKLVPKEEAIRRVLALGKPCRIYETRNGIRFFLLDKTYDPTSDEVLEIFKKTGCDFYYGFFCKEEKRFSARLSPKNLWDKFFGIKLRHSCTDGADETLLNTVTLHDSLCWKLR